MKCTTSDPGHAVTLGDVLEVPEFELRLVASARDSTARPVKGAHLTEILDPARWLDRDWVMLTTGLQLHRDPRRQRRLVQELAEQRVTALGYCVGIVSKTVPRALLDEAKKLGFPVFVVPLHIPARLVIAHVNRMLLATDEELLHRAITFHEYLLTGLDTSARTSLVPENRLVANFRSLVELPVDYLDSNGRPVDASRDSDAELRDLLDATSKQGFTKLRRGGEELLAVPCQLAGRFTGWLIVHLPDSLENGRFVLAATQAVARLIAMAVVSRQHSTENLEALRQELMTQLLDRADGPSLNAAEHLETLSQTRALPILGQLGFAAGEPIRALVAEPVSGHAGIAELKAALHGSKLPYLYAARGEQVVAAVQGSGAQVRRVAQRFAHPTGIGGAVAGLSELHRSIGQARFALRATRHSDPRKRGGAESEMRPVDFEELPLAPWMAEQTRAIAGEQRVGRCLEPLLGHSLLLEAVVEFLRNDQDIPAAARRLNLHPNSLRYRLERAEAALGVPLRRPSVLASLYLALTVNDLL